MLNAGGGGGANTSFNRIYNNTIVKNNAKAVAVQDFNVGPAGPVRVMSNNKFVNNFVYGYLAPGSYNELLLYWDQLQNTNDRWINNVFGNSGGSATELIMTNKTGPYNLAGAIATLLNPVNPEFTSRNGFNNVYNANPGFANYAGDNFTLPVGNIYINAGAHLTNVRTGDSGSGTTLLVDDAQFFQDGKGIPGVVGDQIAIGLVTTTRQITAINYSANTITLSSSVTRAVGNKIWLYAGSSGNVVLNGSAPDIGAFESASAVVIPVANFACSPLSGKKPLTVNCTDSSTNTPTAWAWTFGDTGTSTLQNPQRIYQNAGTYTVALTASNSAGNNTKTQAAYVKVSQTLFTTQVPAVPNDTDTGSPPYELGMPFRATKAGKITAIRYYKAPSDTGTHTGRVWSDTGTLLASAVFTGETASGWQEQALASPLNILVNTTYVVSSNITTHFAATYSGLNTSIVNDSLFSVVPTVTIKNGVFGNPGVFPSNTFQNANYFRDIVFLPN